MMAGNETTRRRRVQGRTALTSELSSNGRTGRPNTATGLHHHLHHHDHHHHHYHYHHHHHHFPRSLNADQEEGLLLSSSESSSQADPNSNDHQGLVHNRSGLQGAIMPREAATEGRDRLDERLWSSAMQSHRPGFRANLLEEFSLLFEDEEDPWSDDELLELGIEEWLAAVGLDEAVHSDVQSAPEQGLSKALIRRLPRVAYVPQVSREDRGVGSISSDQEDCSVCLEHFVMGQQLICLPCKHRFHPNCLTPWLENHAKCPYCRAKVSFDGAGAASSSQSGNESAVSLIEDDLIAWMEAVDSGLSQLCIR
ncbi:hypothetical protein GOP47_0022209 [Adiantum capillus-veneris]|uniref:RING-type domain-containing protein n=1 Tax=Adiantum capillus-veneris TaxID=13818 RepID=A0A9D4U9B3_ADICA|nr:hypothetical protein GOP47_0022209 [Adiantum capillus-veneris]